MKKFIAAYPIQISLVSAISTVLFIATTTYHATNIYAQVTARLDSLETSCKRQASIVKMIESSQSNAIEKVNKEFHDYKDVVNLQYIEVSGKLNYITGVLEEIRDKYNGRKVGPSKGW